MSSDQATTGGAPADRLGPSPNLAALAAELGASKVCASGGLITDHAGAAASTAAGPH